MPPTKDKRIFHPTEKGLAYPTTRRGRRTEDWHGTKITDSYAWLEGDGPEVRAWEDAQNTLARSYIDNLPRRKAIGEGLRKWFEKPNEGCPMFAGEMVFQWKSSKDQERGVLFVGKSLETLDVLLDPNAMSTTNDVSIDWISPSTKGKYLAYGVSEGGDEQSVLKIIDTKTKQLISDEIPYTNDGSVAWLPDESGFYYTRLPTPGTVPISEEQYHKKVYFHHLGSQWREDPLIFVPENPYNDSPEIKISDDGTWIGLTVFHGWTANDTYVGKIQGDPKSPELKPIAVGEDNSFLVSEYNGYFYILTDHNAPRSKLMRVSCSEENISDKTKWEEVVPERTDSLGGFDVIGNKLVLEYQSKAHSMIEVINTDTGEKHEIPLPGLGTIGAVSEKDGSHEIYYSFESYAFPNSIYKYDLETRKQEQIYQFAADADLSEITTEQITYRSKDGTPVTMFVVKNKNTPMDGNNKTILSGYGGFGNSEIPFFSGAVVEWVNNGGVYVAANLRGGLEYGEEWHRDGMLENKQHVFDDFIAAGEYLVAAGYTKPKKLAIWGGSNGGLTVAASTVQDKKLFGAVVCDSGLLDMVHYSDKLMAKIWIPEYGDPAISDEFRYLYAYSPYHNARRGKHPAMLFLTAENDTRVDPMHARKMVAKLQSLNTSDQPILLLVEKDAGHTDNVAASRTLDNMTDIFAFLDATLEDKS